MAKSMVDKYAQILSQDPTSSVFVELAKALIEQGDHPQAATVCQSGLAHHPQSVVGRVLWGKALINLGKPSEAMDQFDHAIAIDRENPHAYNLIGEVLLHKGLYRSALPLLKKAVALQPNDGRVRQWLEQTQRALAGGPAPVLRDITRMDPPTGAGVVTDPSLSLSLQGTDFAPTDPHVDSTEVDIQAYAPAAPAEDHAPTLTPTTGETLVPQELLAGPAAPEPQMQRASVRPTSGVKAGIPVLQAAAPVPAAAAPAAAAPAPLAPQPVTPAPAPEPLAPPVPDTAEVDPFSLVPHRASANETVGGLTATFDSLSAGARTGSEPSVMLSDDLMQESSKPPAPAPARTAAPAPAPAPAPSRGLLDDIPPPPMTGEQPLPEPRRAAADPSNAQGLLDDIPELEPTGQLEVPKVELSATATHAIAQEYEKELRAKLAVAAGRKTFLARNGLKVAVLCFLGVVGATAVAGWAYTRSKYRSASLPQALALSHQGILQDTVESYRGALEKLGEAVEMDSRSTEAWALTAYARAVLYAEHGGASDDRAQALAALGHPGVRDGFPGLSLACDYFLADTADKDAARKAIRESQLESSEVYELAGRFLLLAKDAKAGLSRLDKALTQTPADVRALVVLGNYYKDSGDLANALDIYARALKVSPAHPEAAVGNAEVHAELGQDVESALTAIEAVKPDDTLAPDLLARRELVYGRLLSAVGRHEDAIKRLTEGVKSGKSRAYDFNMALGDAARAAGQMDAAQRALEVALKLRPKSEDAKEALGRVLIARDREKEVVSRFAQDPDRKVCLVRGMAYAKLGDWKHARAELQKTQVNGKFPQDAVVQLALADAAENQADRAQQVLERLAASKKARVEVRVALGKVYWQRGIYDKARAQFEEASKERSDYEGGCALGRLLLQLGFPDLAVRPLTSALELNGSHGEARGALARALIATGHPEDALKQAEAWQTDNPSSGAAAREVAFAQHQLGKVAEAEAASARSIKLDPNDAEAFRVRAISLYGTGDDKGAFKALERANKLNPKDGETFCEIARAFLRQGNGPFAQKAFAKAKEENGELACAAVGLHLAALPSANKAAPRELAEAVKNAVSVVDKATAAAALARVQLALGQVKDARKSADEAVALAPHLGDAQLALGLVAVRQKDEATARAALLHAVQVDPAHGGAQLALGDLLARGAEADVPGAVTAYGWFLHVGGSPADEARVHKLVTNLRKKVAQR